MVKQKCADGWASFYFSNRAALVLCSGGDSMLTVDVMRKWLCTNLDPAIKKQTSVRQSVLCLVNGI